MSDPGPSSRLPPPIPYTGPSTNGHSDQSDFSPPPPPPKTFRVSNSPIMQPTLTPTTSPPLSTSSPNGSPSVSGGPSSPTSTTMSPSRSWTRIQPQQQFVNGRGNVQLPGAARQFVPSPNPSLNGGSPSLSNGSPTLGVQKEGHQAYVRRDPSPGPSRLPGDSPPLAGAATTAPGADGSALGFLPSQFGVRQRVAIKTSSRPTAPRSSLPGGSSAGPAVVAGAGARRGSAASALSSSATGHEAGGTSPTLERAMASTLPPLPHEKGKAPMYPTSTSGHSFVTAASPAMSTDSHHSSSSAGPRSSSLHPGSSGSQHSSPNLSAQQQQQHQSPSTSLLSPSPALSHTSVLDRPRPRTPDPYGSGSSVATFASRGGGSSYAAPRPSAPAALPSPQAVVTPTTAGTSVLDRPRPKTPDASAALSATSTTPNLSPTLSRSATPVSNSASTTPPLAHPQPQHPPAKTSVLDRPRPKTPDAGAAFRFGAGASADASRSSTPAAASRPKTPDTAGVFRFGAGGEDAAVGAGPGSGGGSVLDRPRPKTPDSGAVFAFQVPPLAYAAPPEEEETKKEEPTSVLSRPRPSVTSVLDRPRPKTPDAQGWLDGAASTVKAPPRFGGVAGAHRPSDSTGSFSAGSFSSHSHTKGSTSYDSLASRTQPSGLSSFTSASGTTTTSNTASPARPSFDSFARSGTNLSSSSLASGSTSANSPSKPRFGGLSSSTSSSNATFSDAPLLNLDFDFGGSPFGTSETMFGLSDLLTFGSGPSAAPAPSSLAARSAGSPEDEATTPTPTTERKDLGSASTSHDFAFPSSNATTPTASSALVPTLSTSSGNSTGGGYLAAGLVHSAPSASGRSTPRKEPPKVDLKLELELEMERAIPPNRNILDANARASMEEDRAKRVRRERDDDEFEARVEGRKASLVREQASISSLGSVSGSGGGGTTASISDASILSSVGGGLGGSGSPKPQKRRRRRSLASLLSIGSANLLGKDKDKDREQEREEPRRSKTPEPGMRSYTPEPGMRSHTPEPGLRSRTPEPGLTSATYHQPPPQIVVPTASTFAPRLSLDKSLPPTPLSVSPAVQPSPPPSSSGHDQSAQADSPVKRTGAALGRQLSRLRNRSNPSPAPPSTAPRQPAFQVLSATTTRKVRNNQGSISSLGTAETHGSMRRDSYEFGAFPTASAPPGPFTSLAPTQPGPPPVTAPAVQPAASTSSSVPFSRRLVERFTKTSGSSSKAPQPETWTAPVKDHSDPSTTATVGPNGPTRHGRRRSSLSSLLGVNLGSSSASADGHGTLSSSTNGPKKILGMSLPAGRKSEDLLTSGRGRGPEREMRREWESPKPAAQAEQQQQPNGGRRSFDLLTEKEAIPRRPSTDDLLTLATAKLSKFAVTDEPASSSPTAVPPLSAGPSTFESGGLSSQGSGHSTPSDEVEDKAAAVVARAALISRSDAGPAADVAAVSDQDVPLYGTRTAAPVLVRSDSLRTAPNKSTAVAPLPAGPSSLSTVVGTSSTETADSTPKTAQSSSAFHQHKAADSGFSSDTTLSTAWLQLEDTLALYNAATRENRPDRGTIINSTVLPFLKHEEDSPAPRVHELLAQRQRAILFGWLTTLTMELREMQPAHRGACLEAVAGIAESHFFSIASLQEDPAGQLFYHSAVVQLLDFAVDKLNDKAVYANTLVFSGRIFALAFFRIEGVALKLLRALPPVKRQGLKRVLDEAEVQEHKLPPANLDAFPSHLHDLCLRDFRAYASLLLPIKKPSSEDDHYLVRDGNVEVEMSGNWLIRWTASDSDLPFAFYRAYHRQLAAQLVPFEARQNIVGQPHLPPSTIITAPGFLFVAASLLDKADALVHRNLRSVTSIGPNSGNFNTNDSANLSFGQKPKVLELAHRRVVATLLDVIGGPPGAPGVGPAGAAGDVEVRRHVFSGMLPVWIRACVKRTSMWDVRGVFLVLDLMEGLIYTLAYPPARSAEEEDDESATIKPDERYIALLAIPFLFDVLTVLLKQADSTVVLLRSISFLYAHFEVFTLRPSDRKRLCEEILLDRTLFERLLLFWNAGVRGYFIRLIVWRLSRLGVVAQEQNPNLPPDKGIVGIFNLLNVRLEAVRKRHDTLEPLDNLTDEDDYYFRPKRSTICSTRGVKEAPWTVDELAEPLDEEEDTLEDEEEEQEEAQELVRSLPPPPSSVGSGVSGTSSSKKGDSKAMSKVVSWLKTGLGKKQGKNSGKGSPGLPDARIDPFTVERTATVRERRGREGSLTILDDDLSAETASQEWPSAPLPTTVETGIVPTPDSPGPHTPAAPIADAAPATPSPTRTTFLTPNQPFPSPSKRPGPSRTKSSRSDKRSSRSLSPAFFSFEFENGVVTRSDVDPAVAASAVAANASTTSVNTTGTSDTAFPTSPIRPTRPGDPHSAISPRVSLRFSKRISILPPAALDLLKEANSAGPIEAVPAIPARFRQSLMQDPGYDKKLHPYAVRGLRDYEDALDEWTEWTARLWKEEEEAGGIVGKTFVDMVPRLAVNWPLQQGED
ncbi:hypothetical protein JCM6882_000614 [Rhodosporidiobolus microsporus]